MQRVFKGGEKKGRELLEQSKGFRQEAAQAASDIKRYHKEGKTEKDSDVVSARIRLQEATEKADELEHEGRHLLAPDDTYTLTKLRSSISHKKSEIHTENHQELISLAETALHEDDAAEFVGILQKLGETYNENEIVNGFTYGQNYTDDEGKEHHEHEHFAMSPKGVRDFAKIVLGKKLGLGEDLALRFIGDVSDIAEKKGHNVLMRMIGVQHGKAYFKPEAEQGAEYVAEMEKGEWFKLLSQNRLAGCEEYVDESTGQRKTVVSDKFLTLFLRNFDKNTEYAMTRGRITTSWYKAFADNKELLDKATALVPDDLVPDPEAKGPNAAPISKKLLYKRIVDKLTQAGEIVKKDEKEGGLQGSVERTMKFTDGKKKK